MNLILFDNWCRPHLLPLTYTRPAADIRVGITTLREKWERVLNMPSSILTESYLQEKFPLRTSGDNLLVAVTADIDVGSTYDMSLFTKVIAKPVSGDKLKHLFGEI